MRRMKQITGTHKNGVANLGVDLVVHIFKSTL